MPSFLCLFQVYVEGFGRLIGITQQYESVYPLDDNDDHLLTIVRDWQIIAITIDASTSSSISLSPLLASPVFFPTLNITLQYFINIIGYLFPNLKLPAWARALLNHLRFMQFCAWPVTNAASARQQALARQQYGAVYLLNTYSALVSYADMRFVRCRVVAL